MIKKFLRWWYEVIGLRREAQNMLCLALFAKLSGADKALVIWEQAYGHIHDLYKDDEAA